MGRTTCSIQINWSFKEVAYEWLIPTLTVITFSCGLDFKISIIQPYNANSLIFSNIDCIHLMTIDRDNQQDILLLEHMKRNGFDDSHFGQGPRMTVVKDPDYGSYESAIIPYENKFRHHVFQVSRFIQLGDMLKFPIEMKSTLHDPFTIGSALRSFPERPFTAIVMAIVAAGFSMFSNIKELNKMSYIEGWVCEYSNPSFSIFPFDQWLRVDAIASAWIDLCDQDGKSWRLGTVVFCHYNLLKIRPLQRT